MEFSTRTPAPHELTENALSRRRRELEQAGAELIDLTVSNPTRVGLFEPKLLEALASVDASRYEPQPLGLGSAREAVAAWIAGRTGWRPQPQRVSLFASTSEAYALCFKLLCEPGDAVLVPVPSYPLLDALVRLESLALVPYPLVFDGVGWRIDFDALAAAAHARCRALVIIAPNNPTGHGPTRDELARLGRFAAERGLAIVSDEVFADFVFAPQADAAPLPLARHCDAPLVVSLGGLSKSLAAPQLKLAWGLWGGNATCCDEALARLEFASDAYLALATPVQLALPALLAQADRARDAILGRIAQNRRILEASRTPSSVWTPLPCEGGWTVVLRIPNTQPDEDSALALLEQGVCVHPGSFYGFAEGSAQLVLSLIVEPEAMRRGMARIEAATAGMWG